MLDSRDYFNKAIIPRYRPLGPVVLPQSLYDTAKAKGIDMRGYVRQEPMPLASIKQNKPTLKLR